MLQTSLKTGNKGFEVFKNSTFNQMFVASGLRNGIIVDFHSLLNTMFWPSVQKMKKTSFLFEMAVKKLRNGKLRV